MQGRKKRTSADHWQTLSSNKPKTPGKKVAAINYYVMAIVAAMKKDSNMTKSP